MQSYVNQLVLNLRFGLPIQLSLPKSSIAKMGMDVLKMASVVLVAVLGTLIMGL